MDLTKYLVENALVLIPFIYIIGLILKGFQKIDKYIPLILLFVGVLMACLLLGFNVQAIIQGVLVVGVTVYSNQLIKQIKKDK